MIDSVMLLNLNLRIDEIHDNVLVQPTENLDDKLWQFDNASMLIFCSLLSIWPVEQLNRTSAKEFRRPDLLSHRPALNLPHICHSVHLSAQILAYRLLEHSDFGKLLRFFQRLFAGVPFAVDYDHTFLLVFSELVLIPSKTGKNSKSIQSTFLHTNKDLTCLVVVFTFDEDVVVSVE